MFFYQLRQAVLSLKSTPVLSFLIALGIAVGIGVAMTAITMYHNHDAHPIAHKDHRLYSVRLNSWGQERPYTEPNEPPWQLTYTDAMALCRSDIPERKVVTYKVSDYVHPPKEDQKPYRSLIRLTQRDFFPMFEVPFIFGGPWTLEADQRPEQVVVINRATNDRLFGGENSVGATLRLGKLDYRIAGVIDHWHPAPKYYDLNNDQFAESEPIFIPFGLLTTLKLPSSGNTNGWGEGQPGFEGLLRGEDVFLQMWVELPDGPEAFKAHIDQYALEQKKIGRFRREMNNRLDRVSVLLEEREVVDGRVRTMLVVGILVLVACVLNVVGLILGKFSAKLHQIGVRRALGASRYHVFCEHLTESAVIGLIGAVFGLPLTWLGLKALKWVSREHDAIYRFDLQMLAVLVAVSLIAAILGGLFPAWRVCRASPSIYLKIQ